MAKTEENVQLLKAGSRLPTVQLRFLSLVAIYFVLHILLRTSISDSLDYDEAEQALLGQWLLPGYTEQPPLYTWIQYLLFTIFGQNVFAISLLKNSLLFFTYFFMLLAGRSLYRSEILPVLAACGLLLIPQIGWESQRDMTHTTLVTCSSAATLWLFLRLPRNNRLWDYLWLGLALGVGFMSKANFFIFLAILIPVLLSFQQTRKTIICPSILLSLGVAFVCASPYFLWLAENRDIALSASHKLHRPADNPTLHGLLSFFRNSLLFLAPFLAISSASFRSGLLCFPQDANSAWRQRFSIRYLLMFLILMTAIIVAFKISYVKDRWLQPMLFCTPLLWFSATCPERLKRQAVTRYFAAVIIAGLVIYTAFTIRVMGAGLTGSTCRLNYPFAAVVKELVHDSVRPRVIVSDNRFLVGNLRMHFPDSTGLIPGFRFERLLPGEAGEVLVVWRAENRTAPPGKLLTFLKKTWGITPNTARMKTISKGQLYLPEQPIKLGYFTFTGTVGTM